MISTVFLLVALLCAVAAVLRQRSWRARGRDGVTPVLPSLAALAGACLFIAPVTQALASSVVPGVGRLLSNGCTLVAAYGFAEMLGYLYGDRDDGGRRAGIRAGTLVAVLAVLVAAFALGDPPSAPVGLFDFRDDPALTVYVVVYSLYLGWSLVRVLRLAARAVRRTRRHLRVGMAVLAVGCVIGIVYAGSRVVRAVAGYTGLTGPEQYCTSPVAGLDCTLVITFPALSVTLVVLGIGVPFVINAPGALRRRAADARLARDLRPLWRALSGALPQIALTSPGAVDGNVPRHDAALRLYRRTVEVRDAALLLQPYRSPDDTREHARRAAAAGLTGARADAAVEAADLATAIGRYRAASPSPAPLSSTPDGAGDGAEDDDVRAEARRLARVSAAFERREVDPLPDAGQSGSTAR